MLAPKEDAQNIVLIGGGHGLYPIAYHLRNIQKKAIETDEIEPDKIRISTISTTFDSGGHSGKIRRDYGILPPGDLCKAMLALLNPSQTAVAREVLSHRFKGHELDGATLINILYKAFYDVYRNEMLAIQNMCAFLRVKGVVLPVSLGNAHLCARLTNGDTIVSEGKIDTREWRGQALIESIYLEPEVEIYPEAREAILHADMIVFCPGSLFTSLLPNTLVRGFKEAIAETKAHLVMIMNLMTDPQETPGFTAPHFVATLLKYIGREKIDAVICNNADIPSEILERYEEEGSEPVVTAPHLLQNYTREIIVDNLVNTKEGKVSHNMKASWHIYHMLSKIEKSSPVLTH